MNGEISLRDLAEQAGLKVYDFALPQAWVDSVWEITKLETGEGKFPFGFVWCYDKSTIFGEPYPLTDEAKELAKLIGVLMR